MVIYQLIEIMFSIKKKIIFCTYQFLYIEKSWTLNEQIKTLNLFCIIYFNNLFFCVIYQLNERFKQF